MGFFGLHSVPEFERLVVFSFSGRFAGVRGPGLVFLTPGQSVKLRVDLRETIVDTPDQHCLTKDSVIMVVDPVVFYRIVDPEAMVVNIREPRVGIMHAARAALRATVGELDLTDVVSGREKVADELKRRLADDVERWGIEIMNVEIAGLRLQSEVEDAMAKRRAVVENTEADRRATILRAEGQREAAQAESAAMVTLSEARKTTLINEADAERQAQILRAEGIESYYRKLISLGPGADVAIKFEHVTALQKLATSPNAKLIVIPSNMDGADPLGPVLGSVRDAVFVDNAIHEAKDGEAQS